MTPKETGNLISVLRKEKGCTQVQLAELLNVSNRTVSKWENGEGYPDITILPELAAVLEVSVDELLSGKRLERNSDSDESKSSAEERKERLKSEFRIFFVVSLFLAVFSALLGGITEIYSIWAFDILFYTHWEIMFVAVSLASLIVSALAFAVGTIRLSNLLDKGEIKALAVRKGLCVCIVLCVFPLTFIARIIDVSRFGYFTDWFMIPIIIAVALIIRKVYEKIR